MDDSKPTASNTPFSPRRIAESLREGVCPPDAAFDLLLPHDLAHLSGEHWSPLEVTLVAARWLSDAGVRRVVDIGAGPGKFCIAAALAASCEFVGFEQDSRFVAVARALARLFDVQDRARFVQGTLAGGVLPQADAYYLYNPFAQHLFAPADGAQTPDYDRYRHDVMVVQDIFRCAPAGTVVITYNGFGGLMPASYEVCRVDRELPCVLRMWRKSQPWDEGKFSIVDAA